MPSCPHEFSGFTTICMKAENYSSTAYLASTILLESSDFRKIDVDQINELWVCTQALACFNLRNFIKDNVHVCLKQSRILSDVAMHTCINWDMNISLCPSTIKFYFSKSSCQWPLITEDYLWHPNSKQHSVQLKGSEFTLPIFSEKVIRWHKGRGSSPHVLD